MSDQVTTPSGGITPNQGNKTMPRTNYEKILLALTVVTIILVLGVIAVVIAFIIITRQSSSSVASTTNNSSVASSITSGATSSVASGSASSIASSAASSAAPPLTIRTINKPVNNNNNANKLNTTASKSNKSIAQAVKEFKTENNITPNLSLNSNGLKAMSEGDIGSQLQSIKSNNVKTKAIRAEQKQEQSKKNYQTKPVLKSLTLDD